MARKSNGDKIQAPPAAPRRRSLDTYRLLSLIPVLPYHVVADIGSGVAQLAVPLGKHVFDGKVYAVEIRQESLDAMKAELQRIRLTNVELLLSDGGKLPLADESLDGALAAFELHGPDGPRDMLEETRRCLRAGGWLALLGLRDRESEQGRSEEVRIDEAQLRGVAQEVGFRFTARHSLNGRQFMLLMRK